MATPRGRRSRFSSPFIPAPTKLTVENADSDPDARTKTFLDRWVEPPIPAPRPSFAEAGIERHGVVVNMAPLGTRPSAKIWKGLMKNELADGGGRSRRRETSVASTPTESLVAQTPEPVEPLEPPEPTESIQAVVPVEPLEAVESAEPLEPVADESVVEVADIVAQSTEPSEPKVNEFQRSASEKTEDFGSRPETPQQQVQQSQPPPTSVTSAQTNLPYLSPAVVNNSQGLPSAHESPAPSVLAHYARHTPPYVRLQLPLPPIGLDGEFMVNLEQTDQVVEAAVQRAVDERRWPTAYALRTLYDDNRGFPRMVRVIEAVYGGFATPAQQIEFHKKMSQRKKEGKHDRTAEYYFNGDGSDPLPLPLPPPPQQLSRPTSSFSINIAHFQPPQAFAAPVYQTPYTPLGGLTSVGVSAPSSEPPARHTPINQSSIPPSPPKDQDSSFEDHLSKKLKTNDFQASNEEVIADSASMANAEIETDDVFHLSPEFEAQPKHHHEEEAPSEAVVEAEPNGTSNEVPSEAPEAVMVTEVETYTPAEVEPQSNDSAPPHSNGASEAIPTRSSRAMSDSSTSSLSSIDEQMLTGSAFNSPVKSSAKSPEKFAPRSGSSTLNIEDLVSRATFLDRKVSGGHFGAAPGQHISPYTSANNFAAVAAETLAGTAGAIVSKRPITAPTKTGPKTFTFSTVTIPTPSSSSNNTNNNNNSPNVVAKLSFTSSNKKSNLAMASTTTLTSTHSSSTPPPNNTIPITNSFTAINMPFKKGAKQIPPPPAPYDPNDKMNRLKRAARDITERSEADESFQREGRVRREPPAPIEVESDPDPSAARPLKRQRVRASNREARQKKVINNLESEDNSSPTFLPFAPDVAPGSLSNSRANTPNNVNRPSRKPKTGTGLRVKTSPMKKKGGGTSAGIPRASGERNSPTGGANGAANTQEDNDDYCASCGGNGSLVCCDGCTRSFHFQCVDPPMVEGSCADVDLFCNVCQFSRQPPADDLPGLFGPLLENFDRKNPSAFHLPKPIREYFEDVKTGAEGEYEEIVLPKPKNRAGYDEQPDYFRTKDSKGNHIFCHHCRTTARAPDKMIIPCTYCNLYWHLDCVPVPLAKEPGAGRQWKCPLHVDDLLAELPQMLGPAHRFRKIKGASVIRPRVSRGLKNNGHIEIENSISEDEDEQGFFEQRQYGQIYRLPEQGIKLDFIEKIKSKRSDRLASTQSQPKLTSTSTWTQRSLHEQQAALNLAAVAARDSVPDGTSLLISALLAEAPANVVALMAQGDAPTISEDPRKLSELDRQALLAMQKAINQRLAMASNDEPPQVNGEPKITPQQSPLHNQSQNEHESVDKEMIL